MGIPEEADKPVVVCLYPLMASQNGALSLFLRHLAPLLHLLGARKHPCGVAFHHRPLGATVVGHWRAASLPELASNHGAANHCLFIKWRNENTFVARHSEHPSSLPCLRSRLAAMTRRTNSPSSDSWVTRRQLSLAMPSETEVETPPPQSLFTIGNFVSLNRRSLLPTQTRVVLLDAKSYCFLIAAKVCCSYWHFD